MVPAAQALSSCGTTQFPVTINEVTFYTDEGPQGAFISHLFSADSSNIGVAAWNNIREGMSCVSAQDVANIKAELEKLCSEAPCNQPSVKALRAALSRLPRGK